MSSVAQAPTVAILLCTRNGARFLAAQLDSIAAQTHRAWTLWVSDDGSTDDTVALLERYRRDWGAERLHILSGPGLGSSANFLSLVCNPAIAADYYAYCDQDDIWYADKLARAVASLADSPADTPSLYCARTDLIDEEGRDIGASAMLTRPPGFANALVQNIGGGNTMVFNAAACALLREAGPRVHVVVHDWWTYMCVSGCGGIVRRDPQPCLKYRQHGGNQIGSNLGLAARLVRAGALLEGRFRRWTDINMAALAHIESRLTPQNRRLWQQFTAARTMPRWPRLIALVRSGIYRQTFLDNVGLYLAAALNRL